MSYADDSDVSSTDAEDLYDQTTEVGMDRWLRLPGETDLFKGEGRPDTKFLALGDAKLPVFDEITAWMKRANKPPQEEIFRGRTGFHPEDAERNYMVAEKRYNMDIPLKGIENDVKDREFYDRWSETLDFRWNHDFADLRLRRAKNHGWKWRLIRIRPDGSIVVSPFIKPAQVPFRERGRKSTDVSRNRISAHQLLDNMRAQAQARWRGMPISDKEEREDEAALKRLRYVEGLRNNYGFMGEMLCGMAADTGSGVRILVVAFLICFALLFCYGPPAMIPFLSEFLCGILPLQSTLRGVLTAANDMNRHPGEPYTEGNVRQWLLYWPLYQALRFAQGWVYLVRPSWYRAVCGWRTAVCFFCGSIFFSDHSIHPADAKETRMRLLRRIWRERGDRMAEEAIAFQAAKVLGTTKGKGPAQGRGHNGGSRFNPKEHAQQVLNEARVLHGLVEETFTGGEIATASQARSLGGTSLRAAIHALQESAEGVEQIHTWEPEKQEKFEGACRDLERAIGKTYTATRTQVGAEAFRTHLKNLYQASDESIAQYLQALSVERGVVASRRNGANKAWSDKTFIEHYGQTQRTRVYEKDGKTISVEREPGLDDREYKYDPQKSLAGLAHRLKEDFRQAAAGDMAKRHALVENPAEKQKLTDQLQNSGYGNGAFKGRLPWNRDEFAPHGSFSEDMTGLIHDERRHPGTGIAQRPGREAPADSMFMYKKLTPEERLSGLA